MKKQQIHTNTVPVYMIIYVYGGATGRRAAGGFLSKASTQYPYYPKLDYYYPLPSITVPESTTLFCLVPRTGSGPRGFSQQKVVSSSSGMISHWAAWTKSQHVSRCRKMSQVYAAGWRIYKQRFVWLEPFIDSVDPGSPGTVGMNNEPATCSPMHVALALSRIDCSQ